MLNLFFVAVLQMTVNGVAIATVVSNAVSSALLFYGLVKTKELIHVEWKELRIDRKILGQIMRIGLPAGIQRAVFAQKSQYRDPIGYQQPWNGCYGSIVSSLQY